MGTLPALLALAAACAIGGCERGCQGPPPAPASPVDAIVAEIQSRTGQLSRATRAFKDAHGRWPATLAEVEKVAAERRVPFDGGIYESVTFAAEPDGGVKIEYVTRERRTASGVDGPGKGTITLPRGD